MQRNTFSGYVFASVTATVCTAWFGTINTIESLITYCNTGEYIQKKTHITCTRINAIFWKCQYNELIINVFIFNHIYFFFNIRKLCVTCVFWNNIISTLQIWVNHKKMILLSNGNVYNKSLFFYANLNIKYILHKSLPIKIVRERKNQHSASLSSTHYVYKNKTLIWYSLLCIHPMINFK